MPRFYGWRIVAVAFVCHAVNTGLVFYAWGVFLTPLAAFFGGRAGVAGGYSLMQVASAGYSLLVGPLLDRHGARPIALVGAVALGTGFVLLAFVQTLPQLYACLAGPIALGATCIGLPNNAAVARWFIRKRGRALGLSTAGISFGGIVFAPLAQFLIDSFGWRTAYGVLGLVVVAVLVPPVALSMRRDPADLGLRPDGEALRAGDGSAADLALYEREIERSIPVDVAVRTRSFWLLSAVFGLTMTGLGGVLLYQVPLLIERGMPPAAASLVLGTTAAMGVVGKLGFGALLDRFDQRRVAAMCFCLQALGVLVLWQTRSIPLLVCYVLLYGYAMGGNATLQASLVGETFGRLHYGAIAGRMTPFVVLAQALGVPATGLVRDHVGSYAPALIAVVAASLLAAALVLRVELPPRRPSLQRARALRT